VQGTQTEKKRLFQSIIIYIEKSVLFFFSEPVKHRSVSRIFPSDNSSLTDQQILSRQQMAHVYVSTIEKYIYFK